MGKGEQAKSRGAVAFCQKLDAIRARDGKGAVGRLREACDVSWASWWAYRSGARRPSESVRNALQTMLGIDPALWLSAEERKRDRARAASSKRAAA